MNNIFSYTNAWRTFLAKKPTEPLRRIISNLDRVDLKNANQKLPSNYIVYTNSNGLKEVALKPKKTLAEIINDLNNEAVQQIQKPVSLIRNFFNFLGF